MTLGILAYGLATAGYVVLLGVFVTVVYETLGRAAGYITLGALLTILASIILLIIHAIQVAT